MLCEVAGRARGRQELPSTSVPAHLPASGAPGGCRVLQTKDGHSPAGGRAKGLAWGSRSSTQAVPLPRTCLAEGGGGAEDTAAAC